MHDLDLKVGNELQRSMQAIGDVAIVMMHPIATGAVENLHLHAREQMPLVFMNSWIEERMASAVDEVERTPIELKRLIDCYLPEKWGLVAVSITRALVGIMKSFFVGSQLSNYCV